MDLKRWCLAVFVAVFLVGSVGGAAWAAEPKPITKKEAKLKAKRDVIDATAAEALQKLLDKSPSAEELFKRAYGYAVFDNLKIAFGISGGGGNGVAVNKETGQRTYMKMGTAGIGLGLGGQKYQVIFFFADRDTFDRFVNKGWEADATAQAVAGSSGANAKTDFRNGMAVYQMTEAGLMAHVDIAGTKYWKNDKLNALGK
ncbi:MAG: hypothetical protein GXP47_00380 [Acidobacteria bacterium]|nr:hypothetical protein [Acidobacteriota bacterium]